MVKKYLVAFAMTTLAAGALAAGCSSDDNNNNNTPADAGPDVKKKDTGPIVEPDEGPACTAADVSGFKPKAVTPLVGTRTGKCSAAELDSFEKCLTDFPKNAADCLAAGLDVSKGLSADSFKSACGTCLFTGPTTPAPTANGAFYFQSKDNKALLTPNESGCYSVFAAPGCDAKIQAGNDCATAACGSAECQTSQSVFSGCLKEATGCQSYFADLQECLQPTMDAGKVDGGKVIDAGVADPLQGVCGKLDEEAIAKVWGAVVCGK